MVNILLTVSYVCRSLLLIVVIDLRNVRISLTTGEYVERHLHVVHHHVGVPENFRRVVGALINHIFKNIFLTSRSCLGLILAFIPGNIIHNTI